MNKLKNIIVLKGMSSNIVHEAIVILKPNVKLKQNEYILGEKLEDEKSCDRKMIYKEAENVIKTYIEKIESKIEKNKNNIILKRYKFLQILSSILIATNIILIISLFK